MKYISGWEALNIVKENGETADWHPLSYFHGETFKMYELNEDNPLGKQGIKYRFIPLLKGEFFVAGFARAIADLLFHDERNGLKYCVKDYLNDEEARELFDYLKILSKVKDVEEFMKWELTLLYFEEKEHAGAIPTRKS